MNFRISSTLKDLGRALIGMAPWAERHPTKQSEGRRFDSLSWHMPGLQARSPVGGVQEATDVSHIVALSPSLSPCLPLSLKINE